MAYMERYAYRPASGSCEQFVYGGCGGNGNRYGSREECEERCAGGGENRQEQAALRGDTGEARAEARRRLIIAEKILYNHLNSVISI